MPRTDERQLELEEETADKRWDVTGINEIRRMTEGCLKYIIPLLQQYQKKNNNIAGVGFLIHKRIETDIVKIHTVSVRVFFCSDCKSTVYPLNPLFALFVPSEVSWRPKYTAISIFRLIFAISSRLLLVYPRGLYLYPFHFFVYLFLDHLFDDTIYLVNVATRV